jgi:pimeloyl-ACP methyl ester carboxylesterase
LVQFVIWVAVFLAGGALLGAVYQWLGTRRDGRQFPAPGRLVALGTHRLHVLESGERSGAPTVLLEAGLMSTILSWSNLQQELSRSFRVVSYDRAGLGWSELGPMPRTSDRIVDELRELLRRAGIAPPYVLVGHSFAGLTMPLFAARFPEEIAGMVLVDPVAPAEWNPPSEHDRKLTRIGAKICRRSSWLARIGVLRFVRFLLNTRVKQIAAALVRLISRGSPREAGTVASPWFSALPDNERDMAAIFWVQPKFALTIASQLENLPANAARLAELKGICEKPVVILSAATAPVHRQKEHAAMVRSLPFGTHVLAEESNHWIMQKQPELVIRAIEHVIENSARLQADEPKGKLHFTAQA